MKIMSKWWIWATAAGIVVIVAMLLYPPVFYLNDDVTMRSILSGAYTGVPDGHAVYMKYPLTGILALLYKVMHFVPWFELFLAGSIWGCMLLLIYHFEKPYVGFGVAIALYLPFCLHMHYTIVAAVVAATAIFLIALGKRKVWPVLLLLLSYMIRSQVGLLSLPFVAAAVVWRLVVVKKEERKEESIYWAKHGIALVAGVLLCSVVNYCFYAADDWKSYSAYNDSRTLLYDYTDFLSTDQYAQSYASYGMSAQEYDILASYDTMLDADIDEIKMQEIAERISEGMASGNSMVERLKDTVRKYYLQIRYSDMPFNYLWLGAYLLLGIGFVLCKKWLLLAVLGILGVGRSCIWIYLIWQGRFPERVSVSLYILELMLLLGMGLWLIKKERISSKGIRLGVVGLCCLALGGAGVYQWHVTVQRLQESKRIQSEWTTLKQYCAEEADRMYLVDVFSVVEYADFQYAEDAENMMLLGGWMSASPLAKERFAKLGYTDGAECLYYDEAVSLIVEADNDVAWLEKYLQNRFGECKLEAVGAISNLNTKSFVEYRVIQIGE